MGYSLYVYVVYTFDVGYVWLTSIVLIYSHQESEDESMPEKGDDIARVGPPRLIAYKPEPRKTRVGKVLVSLYCL